MLGLAAQAHSHMSSIPARAQAKSSMTKTPLMRERSDTAKSKSEGARGAASDRTGMDGYQT